MKTIEECEKNINEIEIRDFHSLCEEYQVEGKMGRIRFPKRLKDLHRKLTGDYKSSNVIITAQMCDVLNNDHLRYCDNKILKINDALAVNSVQKEKEE